MPKFFLLFKNFFSLNKKTYCLKLSKIAKLNLSCSANLDAFDIYLFARSKSLFQLSRWNVAHLSKELDDKRVKLDKTEQIVLENKRIVDDKEASLRNWKLMFLDTQNLSAHQIQ